MYDVVGEASNGQEGVDMYNEFKPDLVTMDINMPVKDGISALKDILAANPEAKVVMLTSESEQKMVVGSCSKWSKKLCSKTTGKSRSAHQSKAKPHIIKQISGYKKTTQKGSFFYILDKRQHFTMPSSLCETRYFES